jgi:hypothetical protein
VVYDWSVRESEPQKRNSNAAADVPPGTALGTSDEDYEKHVAAGSGRILNRLERRQWMRKGQPLLPQLDVKIF